MATPSQITHCLTLLPQGARVPSFHNTTMSKRPSTSDSPPPKTRKPWTALTEEEKHYISIAHARGDGPTKIAQALGRPVATVSHFIKKIQEKNVSPEAAMEISMNSEPDSNDEDDVGLFQDIAEQGGYSQKQVLCFQEMGLVWNMMFQLTKKDEFQADRLTVVLGGNVEGDLKLKPLLVYHSENPRALKGYIKQHFPVIWKAHPQVLVTSDILQDYVISYLSPACAEYARNKNLPNKFLLILDNHSAYHSAVQLWTENIEVLLMPSHKQPMNQGVTEMFMRYYHLRVMQQLAQETYGDKTASDEFWRKYNIKKAIHNISYAWNQVEKSHMNAVWYNLWPEGVTNSWEFQGIRDRLKQLVSDIVRFSRRAGISEVNEEAIEVLFASHADVPSEEEHTQTEPEETNCPDQQEQVMGLKNEDLKELLDTVDKARAMAENKDLNMSRSDEFSQALENAAKRYHKMYTGK